MSNQTKKTKFQFGETPDTFKRNVDVINIHGAESTIEFEFIYRTKKQFAALADEGLRASKEKALAEKEKGLKETKHLCLETHLSRTLF